MLERKQRVCSPPPLPASPFLPRPPSSPISTPYAAYPFVLLLIRSISFFRLPRIVAFLFLRVYASVCVCVSRVERGSRARVSAMYACMCVRVYVYACYVCANAAAAAASASRARPRIGMRVHRSCDAYIYICAPIYVCIYVRRINFRRATRFSRARRTRRSDAHLRVHPRRIDRGVPASYIAVSD